VDIRNTLPVIMTIAAGIIAASCSLDPWTVGESPTDVVSITKVTAFPKDGNVLKSQVGTVRMSHKVHQEKGLTCINCHHKHENPEREKRCAVCHNGESGYNTMHGLCVDCHIARKEGPQKCKECH